MTADRTYYPSLVVFLDERIKEFEGMKRFIVGCCFFDRDRWNLGHNYVSSVRGVRRRRHLQEIDKLIEKVGGIAVLVYADIPLRLLPPGEIDSTDDIRRMSRTDNLWSLTVLSAVITGVAWLQRSGVSLGPIDIYYDQKDLRSEHRAGFENILRKTLPELARSAAADLPGVFVADPADLSVRTVESVQKDNQHPGVLWHGTKLADYFCTKAEEVIARGATGRVLVKDHTTAVCNMISRFTQE